MVIEKSTPCQSLEKYAVKCVELFPVSCFEQKSKYACLYYVSWIEQRARSKQSEKEGSKASKKEAKQAKRARSKQSKQEARKASKKQEKRAVVAVAYTVAVSIGVVRQASTL
ncbi:hypothetical protein AVEN_25875-1 [Araneus ventricosus]|uniref:Uncharacterized protein n=1 Tax=Araneus ventricosus TaxID=182803 RepID=A0A4Y2FBI6_ARAVE|nr:hypothetical protein AVEN_25875-1 [Araneus ventricosus]